MNKTIYAEDLPYWDTAVDLASSKEHVAKLLRKFGAERVYTEEAEEDGNIAWRIRMQWRGRVFRFQYQPFPCKLAGNIKGRPRSEQAARQMGRRAHEEIKALLIAAAFELNTRDVPAALFGYMELPTVKGRDGIPARAADLTVEQMQDLTLPALPGRSA